MTNFNSVKQKISQHFIDLGYKNKNHHLEKSNNKIFSRIYFQDSGLDKSFYINVTHGFFDNGHQEQLLVKYRLSNHGLPGVNDFSWSYTSENEVINAIRNVLLPWLSVFNQLENISLLIEKENSDIFSEFFFGFITPDKFVEKYTKLTEEMKALGFEIVKHSDSVIYCKKEDNFWDIVKITMICDGTFATIKAACWCPELEVTEENKTKTKPSEFNSIKTVNGTYIDSGKHARLPTVPIFIGDLSEKCVKQNTDLFCDNVKNLAIPYFNNISDAQKLLETIPLDYLRSSYYEDAIQEIKKKYD